MQTLLIEERGRSDRHLTTAGEEALPKYSVNRRSGRMVDIKHEMP